MAQWDRLPSELISEIYSYLPVNDRLSAGLVCNSWQDALNCCSLWRSLTIRFDSDLADPSHAIFIRNFHRYLKTLALGWNFPHNSSRWFYFHYHNVTKHVIQLVRQLNENNVQLHCIKLFDWFNACRFKKIVYHICTFLRRQVELKKIIIHNANFPKAECLRILSACMSSKDTIRHFEVFNYNYYQTAYESPQFLSMMGSMSKLTILKLDYYVLSRGVIDAILTNGNDNLRELVVNIVEADRIAVDIPNQQWKLLKEKHKQLKVSFCLKNICHYSDVCMFLKSNIPLYEFTMIVNRKVCETKNRNYRDTINLIKKYYSKTLEKLNLQLQFNMEVLDDLLSEMLHVCPRLSHVDFHGIISHIGFLRNVCTFQTQSNTAMKSFRVYVNQLTEEQHFYISELYDDYREALKRKRIQFEVLNMNVNRSNVIYFYY